MAEFARGGKSRRLVRGVVRAGVIGLVARVAERAVERVIVVFVTIGAGAWRHHVRAGQL